MSMPNDMFSIEYRHFLLYKVFQEVKERFGVSTGKLKGHLFLHIDNFTESSLLTFAPCQEYPYSYDNPFY